MGEEEGSSLTRWGEGGCEGGAGRPDHGHGVTAPAQALELLVGVRRLSEEGGCCCALLSEKSTNSSFIDKAMEYRAPKTMGGDATIESSLHWIHRLAQRTNHCWTCASQCAEERRGEVAM